MTAPTPTRDEAVEAVAAAFKRMHSDTCYPSASDGEAKWAAEEIIKAYKAAVDRVNRATDAEIGGIHRSLASAPAPASGGVDAVAVRAAIRETEYKYFGDYEFSEAQRDAVETLVEVANLYLASGVPAETKGPYEARICKGVPADCCDYGVVSLSEGREVCRVWREQDARAIAASLSPAATPVSEADGDVLADSRLDMAWADGAKAAMNAMADFLPDAPAVREMDRIIAQRQADAIAGRALAKPAASPAPVRPIGNQGISDYQREIARNMAEGFAAWNAARQEALPSDEPASSPAGGDVGDSVALSMDSDMRNSDFETWACKRGYLMHLHEGDESRRYRYSLTEEAWLGWCAALSQSTSAGRVGE